MTRRFVSSGSRWEALAGYSRAVVDGDWVFVSGTVGQDFATGSMPAGAIAQAEQSLDNIEAALTKAGAKLTDVVRVRVYIPRRADVGAVSGVIKRRLGAARAANTTVCAPLAVTGARVEIEVTALKSRARTGAATRVRRRSDGKVL
ncbi:MAG: RidA family protein [Betaproteobacteria bacterium]|nr:RidA family protein [Betaproteobacteria bacterium]